MGVTFVSAWREYPAGRLKTQAYGRNSLASLTDAGAIAPAQPIK